MTPKMVLFTIDVTTGQENKVDPNATGQDGNLSLFIQILVFLLGESQKLEEMIRELSNALTSVKHEQEYMEVRERVHRGSKFPNFPSILVSPFQSTKTPIVELLFGQYLKLSFLSQ